MNELEERRQELAEINREIQELEETYDIAMENDDDLAEQRYIIHNKIMLNYDKIIEYKNEISRINSSEQDIDQLIYKTDLIRYKIYSLKENIDQLKKEKEELLLRSRELDDIMDNIRIEIRERQEIQFQLQQRIMELIFIQNEDGQMVDYHEQMRLERLEREGLGFEIRRPDNVPLERKFEETLKWKEIDFDDIPDEMTTCPICMDDFNEDDRIIQHIRRDHQNGGCGNVFHFSCINRAARGANPNCPMCGRHFGTH